MRPLSPIRNNKSGLLRWTHQGQRYSLTWGDWNSPVDKAKLEMAGRMIYQDCLIDAFDETLVRYKTWLNGSVASTGEGQPKAVKKQPKLIALLEERLEDSYNGADLAVLGLIQGYGKSIDTPEQAKDFIKWIKKREVASSSVKRYLNTLRSLRKDLFTEIKVKLEEKPKPAPFNGEEVSLILKVFSEIEEFIPYYGFVLFLLNSGCRVSEAIGIKWSNIDLEKKEIHVYESLVRGRGSASNRVRKSTKTSRYRIVPLNNKLYELLISMERKDGTAEGTEAELVFLSPEGAVINDSNFAQRTWKSALKKAGVPHRPPSKCRATFASFCAQSGIPLHIVSALLGHSKLSTTLEHYLGQVEKPNLPEL